MNITKTLAASDLYQNTDGDQGADLTGADLTGAKLTGAKLTGADLTGADLTWAKLTDQPLPTRAELIQHLQIHTRSDRYDQGSWCACLSSAGGALIGNQSMGVALIMRVIPEFDIQALYQSDKKMAVAELERAAML